MKRRRFQSIALIPKCGYVAICKQGFGWAFTFDDPKWRMLFDWANLAAMVNQAERLLIRNIDDSSIDLGCVLRSLIGEICNELRLANPGKVA
jgi:hypothetical protein